MYVIKFIDRQSIFLHFYLKKNKRFMLKREKIYFINNKYVSTEHENNQLSQKKIQNKKF